MKKGILFGAVILLFNFNVLAQNISIAGFFPTIDHSGNLGKRWAYNIYLFGAIQPYYSKEESFKLLYAYGEFGLSYLLMDKLWITASYVNERQRRFDMNARNEHRLFQQLTLKLAFSPLTIKQRLRFDERFIENIITGRFEFSHRLRYLLGASYDLNSELYLMSYTEFFFNTTQGANFRFNENWSALQLGYNINQSNSIELGYLFSDGFIISKTIGSINTIYKLLG